MIRVREPELMDAPDVDEAAHDHALRSLNRANRMFGIDQQLFAQIRRFGRVEELSVLDLGSGGGGFLAYLRDRGGTAPGVVRIGLDRSLHALAQAESWHGRGLNFVVGDARRCPFADCSVDVVSCSLFLHHFDPPEAAEILREAARIARRGVVVCDLSRSTFAWMTTWVMTRVLSRSRLFHVDGPRSVRAAYRTGELQEIARAAGMGGVSVRACFPFRLMLTWFKTEPRNGRA